MAPCTCGSIDEGDEVKVSVSEPLAQGTSVTCWEQELDWAALRQTSRNRIFEAIGFGELQDRLRADGFGGRRQRTWLRLENDRGYALAPTIARVGSFTTAADAIADLERLPAVWSKRCKSHLCRRRGRQR